MRQEDKTYQTLWNQSYDLFQRNEFEFDPLITSTQDTRRGVTLIAKLDDQVANKVEEFLTNANVIEPGQYYYPKTDFHVTMMSIITCNQGFLLNDIKLDDYVQILEKCIEGIKPFEIVFKGITASPSCVLLQGYANSDQVEILRRRIRDAFNQSQLQNTLDSRYPISTNHSTIIRFKCPLRNHKRQNIS